MHDTTPTLQATKRQRLGSRYTKRLRSHGSLPAIVYGHGLDPIPIALDAKEALGYFYKGEKVFELDVEGGKETVLLKDVQFDYLGTDVIHADFARVDLTERVRANISVRLVGEAVGLKTAGAIMMHPIDELEIECEVANLPDDIEVDISALEVGHSLRVRDVTLPIEGMKMFSEPDGVVATIVVQAEEKTAEEEVVEGAEGAEPEVVSERKPRDKDEEE